VSNNNRHRQSTANTRQGGTTNNNQQQGHLTINSQHSTETPDNQHQTTITEKYTRKTKQNKPDNKQGCKNKNIRRTTPYSLCFCEKLNNCSFPLFGTKLKPT
jgi:hypothetical protein